MQKVWGIRIAAGAFILLSVFFARVALEFPAGGGTFPLFSAAGIILLSVLLIAFSLGARQGSEKIAFELGFGRLKPYLLAASTFVYIIAIFKVGYFVSSAAFLIGATLLLGIRNYLVILATAAVLFPAMYAFFVLFLKAQLPAGILI